jgi:hypothetical protein
MESSKKQKQQNKTVKKQQIKMATTKPQRKVKGRGAYTFKDFGQDISTNLVQGVESKGLVNKTARFVGEGLGDLTGIPGAGKLLGNATSWLSRAFGFGSYKIKRNSLMNSDVSVFADNGGMTFSHREFVTDITSSTAFANTVYPINAGNPVLFPFLSKLASNYEEYEFLGLIFTFKSTSALAVGTTNAALGTVIMATEYDVYAPVYGNKQTMEVGDFACSSPPSQSQIHPVECDPRQNVMKKLFVQPSTNLASLPDDARFSMMGLFQIATSGMQAASSIGELWVSYHVRLTKPRIVSAITNGLYQAHLQYVTNGNPTTSGTANQITKHESYPGIFQYFTTPYYFNLTTNATAAFGTYMIIMRSYSSVTTDNLAAVIGIPTANNGAVISGTYLDRNGGYGSAPAVAQVSTNSTGNFGSGVGNGNGAFQSIIVTLSTATQGTSFPWMYSAANGLASHDIWIFPYNVGSLTLTRAQKEQQQMDNMRRMIETLQAQHNDAARPAPTSKDEVSDNQPVTVPPRIPFPEPEDDDVTVFNPHAVEEGLDEEAKYHPEDDAASERDRAEDAGLGTPFVQLIDTINVPDSQRDRRALKSSLLTLMQKLQASPPDKGE